MAGVTPCAGGTASIRPNVGRNVVLTAAAVEGALVLAGQPEIAAVLSPIIAGASYDLSQVCSQDPPPDPVLTQQDYSDLLDPGNPVTWVPAVAKARQWFLHWYWFQACQCDAVNTPIPPPLVAPPGLAPNGGLPSGANKTCWSLDTNYSVVNPSSGITKQDLTALVLPKGESSLLVTATGLYGAFPIAATKLLPNITAFEWTTQNVGAAEPSPDSDIQGTLEFFTSTGAGNGGVQLFIGTGAQIGPHTPNVPIPANSAYVGAFSEIASDTAVAGKLMNWNISMQGICLGDGVASPCCPPDPSVDMRLNQIIELILSLNISGGSSAPTSWKDGVRHNAITGSGRVTLGRGAVGVRLEVTTLPPGIVAHPGDPAFYFDAGFITPLAIDVPLRGQRLVFNPQSFALPEFADGIAWTLPAGMVANLVELLPVP